MAEIPETKAGQVCPECARLRDSHDFTSGRKFNMVPTGRKGM